MSNRKHSYKNLDKYYETDRNQKRRYRAATGSTTKIGGGGRKYETWEDNLIIAHNIPDRELSIQLDRSVTAIQTRRHILKESREYFSQLFGKF